MIGFDRRIAEGRMLFDGSMGALLSSMGYSMECPELLNVDAPEVIEGIHAMYAQAGADVTIANSLGATRMKLERAGLSGRAAELARAAVRNARRGAGVDVYVALDVGSTGNFLWPLGTNTLDALIENYREAMLAGAEAGADLILMETQIDIAECRAACLAAGDTGLPVAASFTFNPNGRTLTGGSPECAALILAAAGACAMGVNCSAGPQDMLPALEAMRRVSPLPVIVQPNAGLPANDASGRAVYPYTAEMMRPHMRALLDAGAAAIGGCCGTTPEHISQFAGLVRGVPAPQAACGDAQYICSTRRYVDARSVKENLVEIADIEDLYDLDADELPLIDLSGLSPNAARDAVNEAQSICSAPFIFRADSDEALEAALLTYAGVAGVDFPGAIAGYGAVKI